MAKPRQGLPGNSGHIHISVVDKEGKNMFARESEDKDAKYSDIAYLSDLGRHFLAGILEGLPDIMPIVAPTVNSYKRLVENFWAPVTVSWGFEHRAASIRLITPPSASAKSTRFEVRVPGADTNPHLVMGAILALGWRGVEKKLEIPIPPLGKGEDVGGSADKGARLAKSLKEATATFARPESIAREALGDEFVDHFAGTREHEIRLWDEAVTDWYVLPVTYCQASLIPHVGKYSVISKWFEAIGHIGMTFFYLFCFKYLTLVVRLDTAIAHLRRPKPLSSSLFATTCMSCSSITRSAHVSLIPSSAFSQTKT
jgi:hypothetical protein